MSEFKQVEPLTGTAGLPWCRLATNEALAPGTFVHIGYPTDPAGAVLNYEGARILRDWLNLVLDEGERNE